MHESINSFCNAVFGVNNNTYDYVVEYELKYKLEADKKLSDAERSELKKQLHLMERLQSTKLKEGIHAWNEKNKGLQLVEHLNFMEQWELIRENKNWKEDNKVPLISELGLEKPSIRMLKYPDLLERMFQWELDVRKAFTEQWNKAHESKNNDGKGKGTKPLFGENDAKTQQEQISQNWDKAFVEELERQLRLVELLILLEEAPEAKNALIGKWNNSYKKCGYTVDETSTSVEQVACIEKWKKCKYEGKDLRKVKGWILYRLSRLDYLKNFMAQWSEKDQGAFIKKWNDGHNKKLIAGKDPFVQFVNILQLGIGKCEI